jgi:hypothetical protein
MTWWRVVLCAASCLTPACGKSRLTSNQACDGAATINEICSWNAATQEYDRDCVYFCSDFTCPAGSSVQRQCGWNAETQAFDRDCKVVCAGDGGATRL